MGLASVLALGLVQQAHAQSVTINQGQTVGPIDNVTRVTNNGTINGGNASAISALGFDPISGGAFIENNGTIVNAANPSTVEIFSGTINSIINSGVIRNSGAGTVLVASNLSFPLGSLSLNNLVGGVVETAGTTALTASRVLVMNAGTITGNIVGGTGDNSVTMYNIDTFAGGRLNGSILLSQGEDRVALAPTSVVTGAIDGGLGADTLTLIGPGSGTLGNTSNLEELVVSGGNWALTSNLTAGNYSVAQGATLTSALAATISTTTTPVTITNSGTINTTNVTGRAINLAGANNSRTIAITNNAGATITSADDAVRVNFNPSGGSITVTNAGTIQTTNGGQALDFNTAASGSATITINNLATGQLLSFGQDAIRPGQGAVVTNAGLIRSDGPANNSYDGVDWQQSSGVVNNQATGTISGVRHGITSDVDVNVTNAGTIIGRNGSGVGSDGTGTVINTGTITGRWDGVATNGDGDGVDIDFIGTVVNSGVIQGLTANGVDSGGRPNSAEGVAMGGGSITNNAGATIFGGARGVLINHDTNAGGVADGATTIVNAGVIRGGTGEGISFVGNFNDSITNSGLIAGGNGVALDMGGGNDSLTLTGGASFVGRIDGGAGTDTITLGATNAVGNILSGAVNFENLVVTGTGWSLAQVANFDNGISITASGSLSGNATTLVGPIANAGQLIVDQSGDGAFVGRLSGNGALVKTGAGNLTIAAQTGFTGATTVAAGRLGFDGTLGSGSVFVLNGATLGGNGTVGATNLASGATIAPGNSIGTITVNGAFTAQAGSTYLAETTSAGLSDLIAVNGTATIAPGARLAILRDGGTYRVGQRFTVITATGGITGSYTLLQDANALTELRLGNSANGVFVDVARTAGALTAMGGSFNQRGVAAAVGALGVANPLYANLTLNPSDEAVRAAFDSLSGEVHASVLTTMLKDGQAAEAATLGRIATASGPGIGVWAQLLYRTGTDNGDRFAGRVRSDTHGAIGGIDIGISDWGRIGIAGGYSRAKLHIDSRASDGRAESTHLLGYAGATFGALRVKGTIGYAWTDIHTRRSVAFTGFGDTLSAAYDGSIFHGAIDAGYALPFRGGTVEPFATLEAYAVKRDAFTEAGGAAALTSGERTEKFLISTLGARTQTPIVERLSANGSVGWRHAFDNLVPTSLMRFANGTVPFRVAGQPVAENAVSAAIALTWTPTERVTITGGYAGIIGKATDDSRFQIGLAFGF